VIIVVSSSSCGVNAASWRIHLNWVGYNEDVGQKLFNLTSIFTRPMGKLSCALPFCKRIPRLFVLHVVCTCESVLVTLFLVGASCTHVPIFDVESTRVAYILVGEVLCFVRLVLASWDGRHKLVTSHIWHGRHVNLGCSLTASSFCLSTSASSSASSCCSATSSKLLWCVAIPLLILG